MIKDWIMGAMLSLLFAMWFLTILDWTMVNTSVSTFYSMIIIWYYYNFGSWRD